jgi:hypothetical protein
MLLIGKRESHKTSVAKLIESQQGLSVTIPVLQVDCKIHFRKLLPEFEFVRILTDITEYWCFNIQLVILKTSSPEKISDAYPYLSLPHVVEELIVTADRLKISILVGMIRCVPDLDIQ